MPFNSGELDYDRCEQPNPVTPTKPLAQPQHNAGAGHYNSDAENSECQFDNFDSDEPIRKKKRWQVYQQSLELFFVGHVTHDCTMMFLFSTQIE
jgi:hypothetical protein